MATPYLLLGYGSELIKTWDSKDTCEGSAGHTSIAFFTSTLELPLSGQNGQKSVSNMAIHLA